MERGLFGVAGCRGAHEVLLRLVAAANVHALLQRLEAVVVAAATFR
jgi:hypothetical protein